MSKVHEKIVKLTPNVDRILAALHHVMLEAERRDESVSQYDLVKTLFLADRSHLNQWGRPITYDNYVAMVHGPVPSLSYNLLKANEKTLHDYQIKSLPWRSKLIGGKVRHFFAISGDVEIEDFLSPSDMQALDDALGTVKRLGFGQVRRLTHEDPAYSDAWQEDGGRSAYDMSLGLLFDEPNFEQACEIAEYSSYV